MPECTRTFDLPDPAATEAFGRRLGELLFPGAVVALVGPLGAGKTFLTRAIAEGLGLDERHAVSSPTFVLIQEYDARLPIYHFDAYRLGTPEEFIDLGAHEYLEGRGVCLIEWADRVERCLPQGRLTLTLAATSESSRRITATATGSACAALLEALAAHFPPGDSV